MAKTVKNPQNNNFDNFDFWTACREIKFDETQFTSTLAILHFISKQLLLFWSTESLLSH